MAGFSCTNRHFLLALSGNRRSFAMPSTWRQSAAGPALLAGMLALAPSFAGAQGNTSVLAKPTNPATVSIPTNGSASPVPKWVREPFGGPGSGKFLRVADTRGMGEEIP